MLDRRLLISSLVGLGLAPGHARAEPVTIRFSRGPFGQIIVPIKVNGEDASAVLDNGADLTVLDRAFAARLGVISSGAGRAASRLLNMGFERGRKATLTLGGVSWTAAPTIVDLASIPLSPLARPPVVAIIGEEFFALRVVEIDFVGQRLVLHDRNGFTAPAGYTQAALKSVTCAVLHAAVEGKGDLDVMFDLGGSGHLTFPKGQFANRLMAGRLSTPAEAIGFQGGEARTTSIPRFSVRDITLAGVRLTDIPADLGAWNAANAADVRVNVEVASRLDLIFDSAGKRMWLRPNVRLAQPFRFQVVGIAPEAGKEPDTLKITSIQPGSPADKAGLKAGDIIRRINDGAPAMAKLGAARAGDQLVLDLGDGRRITMTAARFY